MTLTLVLSAAPVRAVEIPDSLKGAIPQDLLNQVESFTGGGGGEAASPTIPSLPSMPSTRQVDVGEGFQSKYMKRLIMKELALNVTSAEMLFSQKKETFTRLSSLLKGDFVSPQEVNDAEKEFKSAEEALEKARIDQRRKRLEFLDDAVHLSILEARKVSQRDGRTRVEFTLKNDSDFAQVVFLTRGAIHEAQARSLLRITDLIARVESGAIGVGDPYEMRVSPLSVGQTTTLTFFLQVDADTVTLVLDRGASTERRTLFLERTSEEGGLRLTAANFSLEGDLGGEVVFNLTLENLQESEKTVALRTFRLPEGYQARFELEGAEIRQLQMGFGVPTMALKLRVFIPESVEADTLEKQTPFVAVVGSPALVNALSEANLDNTPPENAELARQSLFVVPTGSAAVQLTVPSLFLELTQKEELDNKITVANPGSVPIENIQLFAQAPSWMGFKLAKTTVSSLRPREEMSIPYHLAAPEDAKAGEYEIKLQAEVRYRGKTIKSSERNLRVKINPQANVGSALGKILMGLVVLLVVVGFTVKKSRR